MRDYYAWLAEATDTLKDTSNFVKNSHNTPVLSALQVRVLLADLLVPHTSTEDEVQDWIVAFCTGLDRRNPGNAEVIELPLRTLIPHSLSMDYLATDGDIESLEWLSNVKIKIKSGEL